LDMEASGKANARLSWSRGLELSLSPVICVTPPRLQTSSKALTDPIRTQRLSKQATIHFR
ncbi:Hypothetical predicted protein, partial [Scomber scombrus]